MFKIQFIQHFKSWSIASVVSDLHTQRIWKPTQNLKKVKAGPRPNKLFTSSLISVCFSALNGL